MGNGVSAQTNAAIAKMEAEEMALKRGTAASAVPPGDQSKFTAGGLRAPLSTAAQMRQAELLRKMKQGY